MIKFFAKTISLLFHPLLVLTYILLVLILVDPYSFGANGLGSFNSRVLILRVFLSTFFIPMMAILMLYFLGMVRSLQLDEALDRTGPYIITGIFYLWLSRNFWDSTITPTIFTCFMLAATIALFLAFVINIFSKISIHAVGMGAIISMLLLTMLLSEYQVFSLQLPFLGTFQISLILVLLLGIVLAGIVGSARLYLQQHEHNDIYGGYLVGLLSPFVALQVMVFFGKMQVM